LVAATIGGPPGGHAEKVGGQPAATVLLVGANALVSRRGAAPDDAQVGDEHAVREGAEGCSEVLLGECSTRLSLRLGESLM
jgi:hypothetical protein